jgi:hypothetical protein
MNLGTTETIVINLLKKAVEAEGCRLAEMDFENLVILVIKVNGADEDCRASLENEIRLSARCLSR